ncbi:Acetylxylan esterase At 0.90 angstrom resolution [Mycena maculata]|uniref:Acetylxylan esterase At 0.90 angstrom resolution n=1 Tax=Mycena maculata TaxID=230809 RepID=A0AAD7IBW6_9AGAR|nr:Acetylxylan esterase At 0.90 angstrom resolution [Mycena maculata]
MIRVALLLLLGATLAAAQCPNVHIFGARETTILPGFGSTISVVDNVIAAFPGATSEVITCIARRCTNDLRIIKASCGDDSYAESVTEGVGAVASHVDSFNSECPNTILQGGQIMDDAYCGGGDTTEALTSTAVPISTAAQAKIAAAIFFGDPRHVPGLSYDVGTCEADGFVPRPVGFICPFASNIQSYCDAPDPFCCNGNNTTVHEGYATEYGAVALTFVKAKVNAIIQLGHVHGLAILVLCGKSP